MPEALSVKRVEQAIFLIIEGKRSAMRHGVRRLGVDWQDAWEVEI